MDSMQLGLTGQLAVSPVAVDKWEDLGHVQIQNLLVAGWVVSDPQGSKRHVL